MTQQRPPTDPHRRRPQMLRAQRSSRRHRLVAGRLPLERTAADEPADVHRANARTAATAHRRRAGSNRKRTADDGVTARTAVSVHGTAARPPARPLARPPADPPGSSTLRETFFLRILARRGGPPRAGRQRWCPRKAAGAAADAAVRHWPTAHPHAALLDP